VNPAADKLAVCGSPLSGPPVNGTSIGWISQVAVLPGVIEPKSKNTLNLNDELRVMFPLESTWPVAGITSVIELMIGTVNPRAVRTLATLGI